MSDKKNENIYDLEYIIEDLKSKLAPGEIDKVKCTFENTQQRFLLSDIKFKDGNLYKGQWKSGMRDGYGVQQWPDGSKYDVNYIKSNILGFLVEKFA